MPNDNSRVSHKFNRSPQMKSSVFESRLRGCLPKPDTMSVFMRLRRVPMNLKIIIQHTG